MHSLTVQQILGNRKNHISNEPRKSRATCERQTEAKDNLQMLPRYSVSSSYLLITISKYQQNTGHSPRVAQEFSQNTALHVQVCTKLLCRPHCPLNYSVSFVLWLSIEFTCNFYLLNLKSVSRYQRDVLTSQRHVGFFFFPQTRPFAN